jgi:hypothetical protein
MLTKLLFHAFFETIRQLAISLVCSIERFLHDLHELHDLHDLLHDLHDLHEDFMIARSSMLQTCTYKLPIVAFWRRKVAISAICTSL